MSPSDCSFRIKRRRPNTHPWAAWLFCCLSVSSYAAPRGVQFEQSGSRIDVFDYVEISVRVEEPDAANPFTDAMVSGQFTGPDGRVRRVDGFCDAADGSVYRIRFMAQLPGKHQFEVRYSQSDYQMGDRGTFTARKGSLVGPVRVDPYFPAHFVREGSERHWFWNGTTTYQLLAWDDETMAAAAGRLAGLGVNRIRVALCGRTPDGSRWNEPLVKATDRFKFRMEPWPAAKPESVVDPGYDVTHFNLEFFQKADRLTRVARNLGVVVSYIFYLDGADKGVDPFGKERMGGADERRYYRYAIARLAPFANVMWDLANEYRLFRTDEWADSMGRFVKESDPYHHLVSTHGHGDFHFRTNVWADFAMYQSWDENGGYNYMLRNRRDQAATGRLMPQINEEYGYEDHYPSGWGGARQWPARIADSRRRLAWEISMAGCYQTTGERANAGTGAGPDTGGGWINGRGDDQMTMLAGYGRMVRFFESFDWWTLEPHDDLAGADTLVLAEPGKRYVAYLKKGGRANLRLSPGRYRARWYNPRSGAWTTLPDAVVESPSNWTSSATPDSGDWALLLEDKQL